MRYLRYSDVEQATYPVCFLVPVIRRDDIRKAYIEPFGLDPDEVLVMDLHYDQSAKKTPIKEMRRFVEEELIHILEDVGVRYIAVADGDYFKVLTGTQKVDASVGYVLDCRFGKPGQIKVVYVPNYKTIFYDPAKITAKISQSIEALQAHRQGTYKPPGNGIIAFEEYPRTFQEIQAWLQRLLDLDRDLASDIETFSLKHHSAGIGTIAFAWNQGEGIAFPVDYKPIPGAKEFPFGVQARDEDLRALLREFFEEMHRRGRKLIWHNISFDVYVLIYQLWMKDILDTEGLLHGLKILLPGENWDCTRIIAYLATNSCAGNALSLKELAQEFAGNYAQTEIKDITRIRLDQLLRYNLVDCLSTWYVYEKHWPTLVADQQLAVYREVFQPAIRDIIQMQLTGLPLDMKRVREVKAILEHEQAAALAILQASPITIQFTDKLRWEHVCKRNAKLKKKTITINDPEVAEVVFNPNSGPQLQALLYDMLGLPVIAFTDTKQPTTGGDTLTALVNHTTDPDVQTFLRALVDLKGVAKILTDFIPSFEEAALGPDGWHYLFGNFNLGGTVSGRLSSSDPNLQNLPANVTTQASAGLVQRFKDAILAYIDKGRLLLGKLIKSCFAAPPGWVFVGLDFASLEDRISALTTKDPNKLKVYIDGFDGHALRAVAYWGDDMPDIDPNDVSSVNSIADKSHPNFKKYGHLRQDSKTPTFLLTYDGTWMGMMAQCGFTAEKAKAIEARYHELYAVSDQWKAAKLDQASKDGFVTVAFGLRVRTPLLAQVVRGNSRTPWEAEAEGRTAGNALGQSWCLLNSRAGSEFLGKVRESKHCLDIRPCAQIHDAQYYLLRDDIEVLAYTNEHLVLAVQWQDHPDIWHDQVKLGGEVSVFWPDWAHEAVVPNGAGEEEIRVVIEKHVNKILNTKP